jgi:hypothetical protein
MRGIIAALLLVLAGYPITIVPEKIVVVVATGATALCALGIVARAAPVFTAGLAIVIGEHALVVMLADAPAGLGGAITAGVAIVLLLEMADFDRRFRGAALGPRVLASQLWHWLRFAASAAAVTVVLLVAASTIASTLGVPWSGLLGPAGALAAVGAAAFAVRLALRARAGDGKLHP